MTNLIKSSATRRGLKSATAIVAAAFAVTACVSPIPGATGNYTSPIGTAPVTVNPTPYSEALVCMGQFARAEQINAPRIAVGRILDYTGKADIEGGRRVTQGASLMAMSAFAKSGARLVERFDTSVSEMELTFKNNKLIEDGKGGYAKINAGEVAGSDFYLVGGITELNYNIRSVGGEAFAGDLDATDSKGTLGAKMFVINIAMDLRMVETKTLNVVDVISYQKQIIGREISLGIFDFANGNVFDIGVGGRAQEPIQLAVRSTVERAVLEMMANMYGAPKTDVCESMDITASTNSLAGDFVPVGSPLQEYNGATRDEAYRIVPKSNSLLRGRK